VIFLPNIIDSTYLIISKLRKKIGSIVIWFFAVTVISFQIADLPIERAKSDLLPGGAQIVYVTPLEVIMLKIKIALIFASIFTLPLILYFILKTILKYRGDNTVHINRFWLAVSILASIFMFSLGTSYAYFILLPLFIKYLYMDAAASGAVATYSIFNFVSFVYTATVIFGLIFELPIVLTFLTKSGIVRLGDLIKYRKHIYILFLVIGAIITPPDVISQIMISVPLILFFELSLIVIRLMDYKK
jgi:sec-independent protein translocase protein TatC